MLGYVLLMWSNPVRASLRDGARAVQRYPALALVLGVLRVWLRALPDGGCAGYFRRRAAARRARRFSSGAARRFGRAGSGWRACAIRSGTCRRMR